jgi:hypothetical protein
MPGKKLKEKAASEAAKNCRHRRRLIRNALLVMNESGNGEHATAANMVGSWLQSRGLLCPIRVLCGLVYRAWNTGIPPTSAAHM